MTYYKKLERDEARNLHLKEMERLNEEMCMSFYDAEKYVSLYAKLRFMSKQLKLYDREMGYKKEL